MVTFAVAVIPYSVWSDIVHEVFFAFKNTAQTWVLNTWIPLFRFMVGDLSDSDGDTPSEPAVKEVEFQGTEETHRAFSHGTELIPW